MIKKATLTLCFSGFIFLGLFSKGSDSLGLYGHSSAEISRILDKKVTELSGEISGTVIENKVYISRLTYLINRFIKILKSNFDINLKPYEIRKAKREIIDFEFLIKEKSDFFSKKILYLLDFLKMLLDCPDIVDKAALTMFLDLTYHRPVEFVGDHKIGTSVFLLLAALSGYYLNGFKKDINKGTRAKTASDKQESDLLEFRNIQEYKQNSYLLGKKPPSVSLEEIDEEILAYNDRLESENYVSKRQDSDLPVLENSGVLDQENEYSVPDFVDSSVRQEDSFSEADGSEADGSEADVGDDDGVLFSRETNTRYNFRQPKLNMSLRFRDKVDGSNKYRNYLRLFV